MKIDPLFAISEEIADIHMLTEPRVSLILFEVTKINLGNNFIRLKNTVSSSMFSLHRVFLDNSLHIVSQAELHKKNVNYFIFLKF